MAGMIVIHVKVLILRDNSTMETIDPVRITVLIPASAAAII